ncbi:MAG: FAD-dependent oxidoreductase [bacterium]|nr:FAD-dependent oxidoreductase [bacterium]
MVEIAVIGGGAAGIGAAHRLRQCGFRVLLIEAAPQLGGNCVGFDLPGPDGSSFTVDVGVSDFNRTTFTAVASLIEELGLPTRPINQDAHFASPDGESLWACRNGSWEFRSDPGGNATALAREATAFATQALEVLRDPRFEHASLGTYLDHLGASEAFRSAILYPRAAGCFPMPDTDPADFPVRQLIEFWNVHGIVSDQPADRRCVEGGMHRYVRAFEQHFVDRGGELHCGTRVVGVSRRKQGVEIRAVDEQNRQRLLTVDHVVLTGHARHSLHLLDEPTQEERHALCRFRCQRARMAIHQDTSLMGSDRDLWGGFHYIVPRGGVPAIRPTITFHPNKLGRLPEGAPDAFLTMNPHREPDAVLAERSFIHPVATLDLPQHIAAVERLQGCRRTWFAGAWLRTPFVHESALQSGLDAAERLLAFEAGSRAPTIGRSLAAN